MSPLSLRRHPRFPGVPGPVLVVVMDGVGLGRRDAGDAVWLARKPTLDFLAAHAPTARLRAHGTAVGLPSDDDMGNSEVGHNALGAGRIFDQGAKLVNRGDRDGRALRGPRVASPRRPRAAERRAAALPRPPLGRQRAQPRRAPARDGPPRERRGRAPRPRARAARRARRARDQRAALPRRARGGARRTERARRPRLPDRVGRRPHAPHDGPLRRRLGDGRARLARRTCEGRGRGLLERAARPSLRCATRARASATRTSPASSSWKMVIPSARSATVHRWSSATSAVIARSRSRAPSRTRISPISIGARAPTSPTRG